MWRTVRDGLLLGIGGLLVDVILVFVRKKQFDGEAFALYTMITTVILLLIGVGFTGAFSGGYRGTAGPTEAMTVGGSRLESAYRDREEQEGMWSRAGVFIIAAIVVGAVMFLAG